MIRGGGTLNWDHLSFSWRKNPQPGVTNGENLSNANMLENSSFLAVCWDWATSNITSNWYQWFPRPLKSGAKTKLKSEENINSNAFIPRRQMHTILAQCAHMYKFYKIEGVRIFNIFLRKIFMVVAEPVNHSFLPVSFSPPSGGRHKINHWPDEEKSITENVIFFENWGEKSDQDHHLKIISVLGRPATQRWTGSGFFWAKRQNSQRNHSRNFEDAKILPWGIASNTLGERKYYAGEKKTTISMSIYDTQRQRMRKENLLIRKKMCISLIKKEYQKSRKAPDFFLMGKPSELPGLGQYA